jgi:HK97 family phage major capsid protein
MSEISQLQAAKDRAVNAAKQVLLERRALGHEDVDPATEARYRPHYDEICRLNTALLEAEADEQRRIPNNPAVARIQAAQNQTRSTTMSIHVNEPELYRRGGPHSFGLDLMRASTPGMDLDGAARQRLTRHTENMTERAQHGDLEYRDISRVDGQGGYAVPPAWLMDQYVTYARPGRAFANLCQRQTLPGGTDSINIPKMLTGTTVAIQTADNTAVSQTDLTDTFINCPVRTIAGQQSVAIQLIDQSPIAFDDVVFRDLTSAHAAVLDQQVMYGSGASGQVLGVVSTPGVTTIPVASLDIAGIYKAIANAIQTIHVTRFLPPECIVMHPRRWGWLLTLLDTTNRPLFIPEANSGFNAAGILEDVDSQQVVGRTHGLPIVTDPNVATNLGAGTNEDEIFIARFSDLVLWESGIRARVMPEVKAANLTVLLQIYSYVAWTAARYPASIITLSGLTPPVF